MEQTPINNVDSEISLCQERQISRGSRVFSVAILAVPVLVVATGFVLDPFLGSSASETFSGVIVAYLAVMYALRSRLFKNHPDLGKASLWTLRSHKQSVMGRDERERGVIDRAFRTSYRILALVCVLGLLCFILATYDLHLPSRFGQTEWFSLLLGLVGFLTYLPAALVAWNEAGERA